MHKFNRQLLKKQSWRGGAKEPWPQARFLRAAPRAPPIPSKPQTMMYVLLLVNSK